MKRQHFECGEMKITRGSDEKLNVVVEVYRPSGWSEIHFKMSACSIRPIAEMLNSILISYERDIQDARRHIKP